MKGVDTATPAPEMTPGSEAWAARMSASKVAAVVGSSPYESRFSLWHKMAGLLPWDDGTNADEKARGHYLEPALRQWWRDKHPDLSVSLTGPWASSERPWQIASPDGIVSKRDIAKTPVGLIECKTSTLDWEWGVEGTDQVPPYYRHQATWAMDVLGLKVTHFSVLTSYMVFQQFAVEFDPREAEWLRGEARAFMDSIEAGRRPNLDGHAETYRAVRQLHPDIEDASVVVPTSLAVRYAEAQAAVTAADHAKREVVTELADLMGSARRAVTDLDDLVAYRKPVPNGAPCISPARGLARTFLDPQKRAAS